MITILEHRGRWCLSSDDLFTKTKLHNSKEALFNAIKLGDGVETDIRDYNGQLVIAHDMPSAQSQHLTLEELFIYYKNCNASSCLALNIKSSGLASALQTLLAKYEITNYFTFDMATPDILDYIKHNIHFYMRDSEIEQIDKNNILYKPCSGVWIDQLYADAYHRITYNMLEAYIQDDKVVAIISPDLSTTWGRKDNLYLEAWKVYLDYFKQLKQSGYDLSKVMLCSDLPLQAKLYFEAII